MKLTYNLIDWQALAPGLADADAWRSWAQQAAVIDATQPLAKSQLLPMMTARRLSNGSRVAVECAMALLARQRIDAIVFTSRHGELEKSLRILTALAKDEPFSPTDFAMSVHNAAVGSLTIAAKAPLVSTSLSAGIDSFQQGMVEVAALHQAGYQQVLLVDFDGAVPDYYRPWLDTTFNVPYAVGLVLSKGEQLLCRAQTPATASAALPQSLEFLRAQLGPCQAFTLQGERYCWHWEKNHG